MTLYELQTTLESRKRGLGYTIWKQANLITLGVSDLLKDKNTRSQYPSTPQEASPELYPQPKGLQIEGLDRSKRK